MLLAQFYRRGIQGSQEINDFSQVFWSQSSQQEAHPEPVRDSSIILWDCGGQGERPGPTAPPSEGSVGRK